MIRNVESGKPPCPTVVGLDNGEIRDSSELSWCLIRVEGHSALEPAEMEEGQESFNIDTPWDDVRDAVVAESPENQSAAAAALVSTNNLCQSGTWEARHKVQPVQFFVKGKVGTSTSVVRGGLEEILSQVVDTDGLDVYVADGCTVHIHYRLRGGSREDVPGQWTCSQCFAPRCWPVRKRYHRCGAVRAEMPASSKGSDKGNGKGDGAFGPLGGNRHPLRETCRPRLVNRKLCFLEVRLVRGLGALHLRNATFATLRRIGQGTSTLPECLDTGRLLQV